MLFFDFYFFYAASLLLHRGGNPYDFSQFHDALIVVGYPASKVATPFFYPPWALWIFYFFGFLSFTQSIVFISLTSFILLFQAIKVSKDSLTLPSWISSAKLIFFFVTFVPFLKCILFGQLTWIPFAGILFAIAANRASYHLAGGVLLSLVILKPHLWGGVFGFVLGRFLFHRQSSLLGGFLCGACAQALFSYILFPDAFSTINEYLLGSSSMTANSNVVSASLVDLLANYLEYPSIRILGFFTSFFLGFYLSKKSDKNGRILIMEIVPISLLFSPFAWSHDYIALFPFVLEKLSILFINSNERIFLRIWIILALIMAAFLFFNIEAVFAFWFIPFLLNYRKFFPKPDQRTSTLLSSK
jgi:hypothetical protein